MLKPLTNFLSGKLLLIGSSVALTYIGLTSAYMYYQTQQLNSARQLLGSLSQELGTVKSSLTSLSEDARRNQKAQADLLLKIQQVSAKSGEFQQHLKALKNENADIARFLNTDLPAAIIQLQQRPAITGAEQFRTWMSSRYPLLPATEQPPSDRGSTNRH